jgi:hypothetical protein
VAAPGLLVGGRPAIAAVTPAQLLKATEREIERRARANAPTKPKWSLEAYADGHTQQLAAMLDRSCWLHFLCDRQSGKTWADLGILLDNALAQPNSINVFLGLVSTGLTLSVWPKWIALLERFGIEHRSVQDEKLTRFPNGAIVAFGGTDDLKNVRKYLGNRLDNCVFIVDECQDQPTSVLTYILDVLLDPMCTPTTRVILSGVLPDFPFGLFLDLASHDEASKTGGTPASLKWSHHSWGRLDNVHTPEAAERLKQLQAEKGVNHPQLLRDWGRVQRVWTAIATGYHYSRPRNGYTPTVPDWLAGERAALEIIGVPIMSLMAAVPRAGIEFVSVGIDPGGRDRTSLVANGWGTASRKVQHLFEWCTPRNSIAKLSHIKAVAMIVQARFGPAWWFWDTQGALEIDTWTIDSGIPAVKAAKKADFDGQVRRVNGLLEDSQYDVMIGSAVEEDMTKAAWDKDLLARGKRTWSKAWHPDPAESSRYSLAPYWDAYKPEQPDAAYLESIRRAEELARSQRAAAHDYATDEFKNDEYDDMSF